MKYVNSTVIKIIKNIISTSSFQYELKAELLLHFRTPYNQRAPKLRTRCSPVDTR